MLESELLLLLLLLLVDLLLLAVEVAAGVVVFSVLAEVTVVNVVDVEVDEVTPSPTILTLATSPRATFSLLTLLVTEFVESFVAVDVNDDDDDIFAMKRNVKVWNEFPNTSTNTIEDYVIQLK